MKTKILIAAGMMMSSLMFAQPRHDGKDGNSERLEKMRTSLSLSDDQYEKVKTISQEFATSRIAVRKDTSLTKGMAQNKMKKLRADEESRINVVLTKEQQTKWTELKAKREEEHQKRKEKHGERKKDH